MLKFLWLNKKTGNKNFFNYFCIKFDEEKWYINCKHKNKNKNEEIFLNKIENDNLKNCSICKDEPFYCFNHFENNKYYFKNTSETEKCKCFLLEKLNFYFLKCFFCGNNLGFSLFDIKKKLNICYSSKDFYSCSISPLKSNVISDSILFCFECSKKHLFLKKEEIFNINYDYLGKIDYLKGLILKNNNYFCYDLTKNSVSNCNHKKEKTIFFSYCKECSEKNNNNKELMFVEPLILYDNRFYSYYHENVYDITIRNVSFLNLLKSIKIACLNKSDEKTKEINLNHVNVVGNFYIFSNGNILLELENEDLKTKKEKFIYQKNIPFENDEKLGILETWTINSINIDKFVNRIIFSFIFCLISLIMLIKIWKTKIKRKK